MKNYIIKSLKIAAFTSFGAIATISCANDELFRDTNTNPEAFVNIDPSLQITSVEAGLSGGWYEQWRSNLIYGEGFIQHLGGSWSTSTYGSVYTANTDYQEALWTSNYGGGLVANLVDVLEKTNGKPEYQNINGVAKVLKVMVFQRLTDEYGDIPYSEAGLGYYKNIFQPKYDKQKDIYNDFFKLLDEAVAQFNTGASIKGDNFYSGDIQKWKKLANSLRLRCAMRISLVDKPKAQAEIQKAVSGGLFTSNADNCYTKHDNIAPETPGGFSNGNGLSQALSFDTVNGVLDHPTTLLLDKLNGDPRVKILFLPNSSGLYEGINPNHYRWDHPGGSGRLAKLQPYLVKSNSPYLHISYSETQLLLAEAIIRGLYTGNAETYYKNGIEAGIRQWTIFGGDAIIDNNAVTTFVNSKTLTPGKELEEIATQQWLTLFLNGIEAYANYRRTDFPTLVPITRTDSGTQGVIPKRLPFPIGESTSNKANFEEASKNYISGGQINSWLSKVWWDVN